VFLVFFGPVRPAPRSQGHSHDEGDVAHQPHGRSHAHDAPVTMMGPLWILALLALAIGVYFTWHDPADCVSMLGWLTPTAVGWVFSGIGLAWLTYQREIVSADTLATVFAPIRIAAVHKFWLDDLYLALYRFGLLQFSRALGWLD